MYCVIRRLIVEVAYIDQRKEPSVLVGLQCLGNKIDGFVVPCNFNFLVLLSMGVRMLIVSGAMCLCRCFGIVYNWDFGIGGAKIYFFYYATPTHTTSCCHSHKA